VFQQNFWCWKKLVSLISFPISAALGPDPQCSAPRPSSAAETIAYPVDKSTRLRLPQLGAAFLDQQIVDGFVEQGL
jgi:hypothetical protein